MTRGSKIFHCHVIPWSLRIPTSDQQNAHNPSLIRMQSNSGIYVLWTFLIVCEICIIQKFQILAIKNDQNKFVFANKCSEPVRHGFREAVTLKHKSLAILSIGALSLLSHAKGTSAVTKEQSLNPNELNIQMNPSFKPKISNFAQTLPIDSSSIIISKDRDAGEDFLRGLVSGAASRASKEILLHPIDTVRARQQVPLANITNEFKISNISTYLSGFSDLYSGIGPALIGGIPAGAIFFGVKDYSKNLLKKKGISKNTATILSVIAANIPYWLIRTPAEALKTRQQVGQSTSTIRELQELYRSSGFENLFISLYGSYLSNFAYALPADIVKFLAYEVFKETLFRAKDGSVVDGKGLEAIINGALAGLLAQVVTTPLDVARTRIMIQKPVNGSTEPFDANPLTTLIDMANKEGLQSLTYGITPRSARAVASGAIQFASIEGTIQAIFGT